MAEKKKKVTDALKTVALGSGAAAMLGYARKGSKDFWRVIRGGFKAGDELRKRIEKLFGALQEPVVMHGRLWQLALDFEPERLADPLLRELMKLRPVRFTTVGEGKHGRERYGQVFKRYALSKMNKLRKAMARMKEREIAKLIQDVTKGARGPMLKTMLGLGIGIPLAIGAIPTKKKKSTIAKWLIGASAGAAAAALAGMRGRRILNKFRELAEGIKEPGGEYLFKILGVRHGLYK